jgi:signal transduction histidine kinase
MEPNPWIRFLAFAKRVECRMDGWARTKLSADEYADAAELDRVLKRNFWRWLAVFTIISAVLALFAMAIWPQLTFREALLYSGILGLYMMFAIASPWYGYRKWNKHSAWVTFATLMVLMLLGAVTGYAVVNVKLGKALTDVDPERLAKAVAIAMAGGAALASLLVGISRMRLREATQRGARLAAEAERERLARQSMQAELKLLQAQVEPHFLFNTLANLRHLIQVKSPDALAMLDHLIHYLRTALPEIRAETSTLGREAELARAYLEILRIRMGGALEIAIDIPAELAREPFPPLMLITLVENAVKHGVTPRGGGHVTVRAAKDGGRLRVEVDDDGRGLEEPIGQGVGLANIRERLRALFGDAARLDLSGRDPAGTRASIELPA